MIGLYLSNLLIFNMAVIKKIMTRWGGDGGVLNWAIGIDMYTLMCIKLITD